MRSLCLCLFTALLALGADDSVPFGFKGFEIFPIDKQVEQLRVGDVNADGKLDLLLVNNPKAKIQILFNRTGETNSTAIKADKLEINELPPDARFKIDAVASEKRIAAFEFFDLNNDKKPDLVYYGEPKELVVLYNEGSNNWALPKRWPVEDALLTPNAMGFGDLTGDGRTDIVLLGETAIYLFAQTKEGSLAEAIKIPFSGSVKAVQILDINADSRQDLLLTDWDSPNPFRFRIQGENGELGPEIHFTLPAIRSFWADDLDADGKTELITISQTSGRAQVSNFAQTNAPDLSGKFREGQFQVLPLSRTSKGKRGTAWADLNGDGLTDLVYSNPESGQLALSLQRTNGAFAASRLFPSLIDITDIAIADLNQDKTNEVYVLSGEEQQVAVTTLDSAGKLSFPKPVYLDGKPIAMAIGKHGTNGTPTLHVITEKDNKRSLQVLSGSLTNLHTQQLNESFKGTPAALLGHDVNQDGLADLVITIPYERLKILLQTTSTNVFQELDLVAPGGSSETPWITSGDLDGDGLAELLLGQRNFLRAVVLKSGELTTAEGQQNGGWSFTIKDQINGAANNSRIAGATQLRNGTNKIESLFLLDLERRGLTLSQADTAGVWQVERTIPLPFTDFTQVQPIKTGKDTHAIAFAGLNSVGWLQLSGQIWEIKSLDSYETAVRNGRLNDVVSGDLNNDKRKDLIFLETAKNYVDIVLFNEHAKLSPGSRWQVFEERTFRSQRADFGEPREAVIADFSGDGKNDLAILVHDRVILYIQE